MSWRSIRARPRRAPSCSMPTRARSPSAQRELEQHYPARGWVEHDPEQIWQRYARRRARGAGRRSSRGGSRRSASPTSARRSSSGTARPASRSTARSSGRTGAPPTNARGSRARARSRWSGTTTGLLLDPYFSATKIAWILDHVAGARERAERGELACGTIDCFLLWRLTGGAVHATDVTNAAPDLAVRHPPAVLGRRAVPAVPRARALLPEVRDNSGLFGTTAPGLFDAELPIAGMAGDQQAALFGQACFAPRHGQVDLRHRLLHAGQHGKRAGRVAAAAADDARVPARRQDDLRAGRLDLRRRSGGQMAARRARGDRRRAPRPTAWRREVPDSHGVDHGPGLRRARRAALGSGRARRDLRPDARCDRRASRPRRARGGRLPDARPDRSDGAATARSPTEAVRIDGGMAANAWLCQFLADILQLPVERPQNLETTALGRGLPRRAGDGRVGRTCGAGADMDGSETASRRRWPPIDARC